MRIIFKILLVFLLVISFNSPVYAWFWGGLKNDQLVSVNIDNGEIVVLKKFSEDSECFHCEARVSPDGKYIAYINRSPKKKRDIHIVNANGSFDRQLVVHPADDWGAIWTADSKSIIFSFIFFD